MIRRYKIVINPATTDKPRPEFSSNLTNESGYLFYDNNSIEPNQLVNENNVTQYLDNPNNSRVTNSFIKYLKSLLNKEEFEFIYTKPSKVYPLLNNYYEQKVKLNKEPSKFMLFESLLSTKNVEFQDNNFNYEDKTRINNSINKIIQSSSGATELNIRYEQQGLDSLPSAGINYELTSGFTQNDYYINLKIEKKEASVLSTDYSKYFADCIEDGVVLKNCFVDLNKKINPFEFWSDSYYNSLNYVPNTTKVKVESDTKGSKNVSFFKK
jgi:hypothetical protein